MFHKHEHDLTLWNTYDKANKSQVEKVNLDSEMLLFPDLSLVLKFHWNKVESNWSLKLFKAVLYCLGKMARVKRFNQNLKMYFCSFIFLKLAYLYSFTFCTIYVVQCTKIHHQKPPAPLWCRGRLWWSMTRSSPLTRSSAGRDLQREWWSSESGGIYRPDLPRWTFSPTCDTVPATDLIILPSVAIAIYLILLN